MITIDNQLKIGDHEVKSRRTEGNAKVNEYKARRQSGEWASGE